jgi:hypothetical protein
VKEQQDSTVRAIEVLRFHLGEAAEELNRLVLEVNETKDYELIALQVALAHVCHHLHSGWNARLEEDWSEYLDSDEGFAKMRRFPLDLDEDLNPGDIPPCREDDKDDGETQ